MQNNINRRHHEIVGVGDPAAERARREMTVLDSAQLFADRREIQIRHRGERYRLLVTKNGKLILNK